MSSIQICILEKPNQTKPRDGECQKANGCQRCSAPLHQTNHLTACIFQILEFKYAKTGGVGIHISLVTDRAFVLQVHLCETHHMVLFRKTTIQHKVHISSLHLFCRMPDRVGSGFWQRRWRQWRSWYIFVIRSHLGSIETTHKPVGTRCNRPIRNPQWRRGEGGTRHIFSETRIFLSRALLHSKTSCIVRHHGCCYNAKCSTRFPANPLDFPWWMIRWRLWGRVVSGFCGNGDTFPVRTDWGRHTHDNRTHTCIHSRFVRLYRLLAGRRRGYYWPMQDTVPRDEFCCFSKSSTAGADGALVREIGLVSWARTDRTGTFWIANCRPRGKRHMFVWLSILSLFSIFRKRTTLMWENGLSFVVRVCKFEPD